MFAAWILYGLLFLLNKTLNLGDMFTRLLMFIRYFIITIQLCLSPSMWYAAVYSLKSASMTSQGSAINVCMGIFTVIYLLGFLAAILLLSMNVVPLY